jgi:hypothetical protein
MKDKMTDDMKLKICVEAKKVFYKEDKDKDYSKNTLHKIKSQIKCQLDKKSLDWETQKNLMYWIEGVGIDYMNNIIRLKSEHAIELRKKDNEIKSLKESLYGLQECVKAERINMRDTIKKQYEDKFIDKYSTENFKQIEEENNYLRNEITKFRTANNQQINELNESWEKKYNELVEKNNPAGGKCKKCRKYKKQNLSLQTKLLKYEGDSSSSSDSDSDSE